MSPDSEEFYRIQKLPPYVFAVINEMRAKARAAQIDVIDLGMGNPDGATPRVVVQKLVEAARNARNHRYSQSRGIPKLREEITRRYRTNYGVELDPDREAIVTIGAKDALAHLLFATVGPGDAVVSPNPAYPIHQYGVLMAEGCACMLPMPDAATFLNRLEDLYRQSTVQAQAAADLLPAQPHHHLRGFGLPARDRPPGAPARHHDHSRFRLRRPRLRRLPAAQHPAGGGRREVAVEIFSMSKSYNMAGWRVGFCLGNARMIAALGAHQELPGLRRLPAHPDRFHHRPARVRRGYAQDLRHLPEAPRRAGGAD